MCLHLYLYVYLHEYVYYMARGAYLNVGIHLQVESGLLALLSIHRNHNVVTAHVRQSPLLSGLGSRSVPGCELHLAHALLAHGCGHRRDDLICRRHLRQICITCNELRARIRGTVKATGTSTGRAGNILQALTTCRPMALSCMLHTSTMTTLQGCSMWSVYCGLWIQFLGPAAVSPFQTPCGRRVRLGVRGGRGTSACKKNRYRTKA